MVHSVAAGVLVLLAGSSRALARSCAGNPVAVSQLFDPETGSVQVPGVANG